MYRQEILASSLNLEHEFHFRIIRCETSFASVKRVPSLKRIRETIQPRVVLILFHCIVDIAAFLLSSTVLRTGKKYYGDNERRTR